MTFSQISERLDLENPRIVEKLGDMLAEIIYSTKESHPDLYEKYKMELYIMANGKILTEEMAEEIVDNMQPYGEYWDIETTTAVKNQYGIRYVCKSNKRFYIR